jgi:toluene monooxygenase system protein E
LGDRIVTGPHKLPSRLKTYSRLARERRMPSDYELVTTDLLYYVGRGFEVSTPISEWYAKHQTGSALVLRDAERFVDPRETTYAKYTELAQAREAHVDGVLQSIEDTGYDRALGQAWKGTLGDALGPLRFPVHAFQMIAAYIGQMAPSGRIVAAAAFQTADELRRIQRIAYRMAQLRATDPAFGEGAREAWQRGEAWQPLRETVERCMVTYDWAEALVALNVCIKPVIDELFMVQLPRVAKRHDDALLGQIFGSLDEDCRWHREWTVALLETAIREQEANREVIRGWVRKWSGPALRSATALAAFGEDSAATSSSTALANVLRQLGLEVAAA